MIPKHVSPNFYLQLHALVVSVARQIGITIHMYGADMVLDLFIFRVLKPEYYIG